MEYKKIIRCALSLLALFAVSFYFIREFQKNWMNIHAFALNLDWRFVVLSFAAIAVTYLLATYGWFLTVNALSDRKITFSASVATVNTGNLTKYIPGKVWSYAFQMYWLADAGFSKSLILYVNLVNLYVALITSTILGLSYLIFSPAKFLGALPPYLLAAFVLFDLWFIKFHAIFFKRFISAFNRTFKREIGYYETPTRLLLRLHLINFTAAFFFGLGAYLLCFGIGFAVDRGTMLLIMSSMMIADVMGFVAVIVPGGLGVRESVMYLLLSGASSAALALILPIATRIVSMIVDIFLGSIGFLLLRQYSMSKKTVTGRVGDK
jgi:uncharacterized membrane protein YbhN (UPF0104 family)